MSAGQPNPAPDTGRNKPGLRRSILWLVRYVIFMAITMFVPAGRLDWTNGWIFLGVYVLLAIAALAYLCRVNPEIIVARSSFHRAVKAWDKLLLVALIGSFLAMMPVAGFDCCFQWSDVPTWLVVAGYISLVLGTAGNTWVFSVNKFAEPVVRIQTERNQTVIDTGPYAVVRHPLYATAFFLCAGTPLALGSYWAFVPAAIGVLTIIVRTAMEDRMLQDELAGYKEYAGRVRYRLVPGVW
jgi:protein-S-isoprenylcysteine O-methyltransferase Ste14